MGSKTLAADPELDCGAVDDPQRAGDARGARLARPSAHERRARADRRRAPLLRRSPAAQPGRHPARPRARPAARAPRGRRGDARHDRDALAGHQPAGHRLGAADRHGDHPPRRGPAPAAPGPHGRRHHLDRRGDEEGAAVRAPGRPGLAAWAGAYLNERLEGVSLGARTLHSKLNDPLAGSQRARLPRAPGARLHRAGRHRRGQPLRGRRRPPAVRAPLPGPDRDQRAHGHPRAPRGAAQRPARRPRPARRARAHRPRERAARPALAGLRRLGLRAALAPPGHRLGPRARAHGLRRPRSAPCARPPTSSRASSRTSTRD